MQTKSALVNTTPPWRVSGESNPIQQGHNLPASRLLSNPKTCRRSLPPVTPLCPVPSRHVSPPFDHRIIPKTQKVRGPTPNRQVPARGMWLHQEGTSPVQSVADLFRRRSNMEPMSGVRPAGTVYRTAPLAKHIGEILLTLGRFPISRTYSNSILTHQPVATFESWVLLRVTAHQTGTYKSGPARHQIHYTTQLRKSGYFLNNFGAE